MIRHIVLWRLRSADHFETIRRTLQAQEGRIPGLLRDFESRESLTAYHRHRCTSRPEPWSTRSLRSIGSRTMSFDYQTPMSMRTANR